MKAKILFITMLFLLQSKFIFPQCMNVELSITWEEGLDIFNKKSKVSIPKLNITYRNDCDNDHYYLRVSPKKDATPVLGCGILLSNPFGCKEKPEDYLKRIKKTQGFYKNQSFNVVIGIEPSISIGWFISRDSTSYFDTFSESVSCGLKTFYEFLYPEYCIKIKNMYDDFASLDTISDSIMFGAMSELFVFLKAGETFTVSYNLIGFQLEWGCYTFMLDKNTIENFITNYPKVGSSISYGALKIELPAKVGEYLLYSGSVNTNKVTVCFGER